MLFIGFYYAQGAIRWFGINIEVFFSCRIHICRRCYNKTALMFESILRCITTFTLAIRMQIFLLFYEVEFQFVSYAWKCVYISKFGKKENNGYFE